MIHIDMEGYVWEKQIMGVKKGLQRANCSDNDYKTFVKKH